MKDRMQYRSNIIEELRKKISRDINSVIFAACGSGLDLKNAYIIQSPEIFNLPEVQYPELYLLDKNTGLVVKVDREAQKVLTTFDLYDQVNIIEDDVEINSNIEKIVLENSYAKPFFIANSDYVKSDKAEDEEQHIVGYYKGIPVISYIDEKRGVAKDDKEITKILDSYHKMSVYEFSKLGINLFPKGTLLRSIRACVKDNVLYLSITEDDMSILMESVI